MQRIFVITRPSPNTHAVPLIPIDLLPPWLEIVGIPRTLRPDIVDATDVINLGYAARPEETLQIRIHAGGNSVDEGEERLDEGAESPGGKGKVVVREKEKGYIDSKHLTLEEFLALQRPSSSSTSSPKSQSQAQVQVQPRTRPRRDKHQTAYNTGARPGTEYCRHWCLHGVCKWTPHCRYIHTMPTTSEGFRSVGLHGVPKWWRVAVQEYMRGETDREGDEEKSDVSGTAEKDVVEMEKLVDI